ncbi:MAG: ROK family protein [Verrucomicrobiales bacterium]|nr:ROK family protein [Verrucomicrobiales bacterium]
MENLPLLGGVEAGGTKFVCAIAREPDQPLVEERFPTTNPDETLARMVGFFRENGPVSAIGIGTFGPAELNPDSPEFGRILTTPKAGWAGADLVGALRAEFGDDSPISFETDVNAAAVGEAKFGAGQGKANVCYVTVGTGIGGGFLHERKPIHGRMHPEIGHTVVPDFNAEFEVPNPGSACPFHENCFEGRASGTAMARLWDQPATELPADHPAWKLEAKYLAHGAMNLTAAWSPDVIILGGGVLQQESLIESVRTEFAAIAGDYWDNLPPMTEYLVTPGLGQQAGIVGALCLASGRA